MFYPSIAATQQALAAGEVTTVQLVENYLASIDDQRYLNIYVEVFADEALDRAREQDRQRQNGDRLGRLAGVIISIKDVICYAGHGVSAGSRMLEDFVSPYTATALQRLLDEGAIVIGRTNCDEFAMGSGNENSHYGPTRNAADPARVPGGSSGGAAVSVQANTCLLAVGSSTGGSVRQPASFCGLYGFKPTYGRISRHGLIAYGSSFDQIGLLSRDPADIALGLEIMAGADRYDATAPNRPVPLYSTAESSGPRRIAYFPEVLENESVDAGIRQTMAAALEELRREGHTVEPVAFDYFDYVVPTYYVLTTAEASSNLSRFDGMRYGYRSPDAGTLEETYKRSRSEGFGTEVQRRILLGTFVLSTGYYDAFYGKAQRARRVIQEQLRGVLAEYDFILMPVSPSRPWPVGKQIDDPVANYLADIYTVMANLAGLPAIAIPTGTEPNGHLPVGYQLMADLWREEELLAFVRRTKK
ncbi:aspartyl-tRNA(Asn)/glutamyl-tRNA(Gln) amidotransferase subunit A [Lewinella marina]|uniref:Glutamyl-tRNA(Gln) amidotransferase subunit A n=1 Tax=Neolewinella marina TaxID=438751 RepID=A0A2G0CB74_9BACT|nr:Asp-tRNA(Asn)/Glu-tRNA(Gln) amidotransferase subunit GatA [Neolewinella marina]NJB87768.1 aspartyl-tRNA(Asn)/glutamyl-tRNA(Gln) amidotransferase subunit A [Neolewinella marina]PHK97239.1 Asp-tRNA(Asn)/Glu-tRNA(Gln) amidotransferase GatCAB subunit A [Neolewinella marina]